MHVSLTLFTQEDLDNSAMVIVIRSGADEEISPKDVVVGDVLRVAVGDILCADGVLLEGSVPAILTLALTVSQPQATDLMVTSNDPARRHQDMKFDESALTGEPDLITKSVDKAPFVLSGTNLMMGAGKVVIVAVGGNSVSGRILESVQGKAKAAPEEGATEEETKSDSYCSGLLNCCGGGGEDEDDEVNLTFLLARPPRAWYSAHQTTFS